MSNQFKSMLHVFNCRLTAVTRNKIVALLTFTFTFTFTQSCKAQLDSIVTLDSAMVEATKGGFSTSDFIQLVKDDTSFYHAFQCLHFYPYKIEGNLAVVDKDNNERATMHRKAQQKVKNNFKWVVINNEKITGKIFKRNGNFNYYTAELFDHIFFPNDTTHTERYIPDSKNKSNGESYNEKNTDRLKVLIFNPGAEVKGVPLVGNKLNIFDEDMLQYYNYSITTAKYNDSLSCYVFTCTAKKDEAGNTNGKAVIKLLISYFDKKSFNVIARKYVMSYNSVAFDFDVTMDVKLQEIKSELVPVSIAYQGFWDVAFKKREEVNFSLGFFDWEF